MKLSVVLASFNGAAFIQQQLDSILAQDRRPDELIVADDGSTDETVEIAERFARRAPFAVTVYRNARTLGYAENFFSAMCRTTGDLVSFCDQDDLWDPRKLHRSLAPFEADSQVSMVAHAAEVVDETLRLLGSCYPNIQRSWTSEAGGWGPAFGGYPGFATTVRKRFLWYDGWVSRPHSMPPNEADQVPHDVWSNLICSSLGRVVALPERLALYRRHPSNTSVFSPPTRLGRVRQSLAIRNDEARFFSRVASATDLRARYLETVRPFALTLGEESAAGLERSVIAYHRYAHAMSRRSINYGSPRAGARLRGLIEAIARSDYRSSAEGGLGATALLRDAILIGTRGSA